MDHSLMNPNQIQMAGMETSDDPFDENWKLSISNKRMSSLLKADRTTVYFD